jgi:hypothetical protein
LIRRVKEGGGKGRGKVKRVKVKGLEEERCKGEEKGKKEGVKDRQKGR